MSLTKILLNEVDIHLFDIGDLKIKNHAELEKLSKNEMFSTDHMNDKPWKVMFNYPSAIDYLHHDGGEIYRMIIAPSDNDIKNKGVYGGESNSWTVSREAMPDIYINIIGDFLAGYFEPDDEADFWYEGITREDVNVYIVTAKTPPNNINAKDSFDQFRSFPEEKEVIILDYNKLDILNIEEYKK